MSISIPTDIGERIKKIRKLRKVNLEPLAKAVHLKSHSNLSHIERGRSNPSEQTLILLAKELKNDFGIPELRKFVENEAVEIEVKSRVVAGKPEQTFEDIEKIYIPSRMKSRTGETFAVLVQGESMIKAGIFHGDIVVLHECPEPFNGQTVLVRIGDDETSVYTLKTWHKDGSKITLKPENDTFDDIVIQKNSAEVSVIGRFAGLIRFGD